MTIIEKWESVHEDHTRVHAVFVTEDTDLDVIEELTSRKCELIEMNDQKFINLIDENYSPTRFIPLGSWVATYHIYGTSVFTNFGADVFAANFQPVIDNDASVDEYGGKNGYGISDLNDATEHGDFIANTVLDGGDAK